MPPTTRALLPRYKQQKEENAAVISNDKNIETFSQLLVAIRSYLLAEKEHMRFSITEKFIILLKSLVLFGITILLLITATIFACIALGMYLSTFIPQHLAFLCIALLVILLLCIVKAYSKSLIEKPLVRIVSSILLDSK